jgi:hypothetical protein
MLFTVHPTYPPNTTLLYVYHGTWAGKGTRCMDGNNSCATIYQWGPGAPCAGRNTSNLMSPLFGWLTHDRFSNESATFLARDAQESCDIWMHVERGFYPTPFNQTACIATADTGTPVPVYMRYNQNGAPSDLEDDAFSAFAPGAASFPAGTFEVPPDCPVTPQSQSGGGAPRWPLPPQLRPAAVGSPPPQPSTH